MPDLTPINLTPDEFKLIERHRAEQDQRNAAFEFQHKAIVIAAEFAVWSRQTGDGLTFSTFTNTFGYQGPSIKLMYETISRIFDAAWPEHIIRE